MRKNRNWLYGVFFALALALVICWAETAGTQAGSGIGYETRLFDQSRVHTVDIVMEDWDEFLETAVSEEYEPCHVVIDGEICKNVAIRGKGNTSLTSVRSYGNDRYSFKVEFDHFQTGHSYHGLDKLSLNNLIQDNTCMKDYFAYTLMNRMNVPAPLCSFVQLSVNGEPWGLYLAVEGVEDSFLRRNYGIVHGELYKPDSMSFGGGRGNGRDFNMDEMMEKFQFPAQNGERKNGERSAFAMPQPPSGGEMPPMPDGMKFPFAPSEKGEKPDFSSRGKGGGGFGGMGSDDVKLRYRDDDPSSYANIFDNAKTNVSEADQARLIAALKALGEGDLSAVNTEEVIRYMAVHQFLCNDDSYTGTMIHNYYLYEEDGVLEMIPWDYNLAYGSFHGGRDASSAVNRPIDEIVSGGGGDRPMADWILNSEETAARYREVYQEFLSAVFDSGWFASEFDRVAAMISPLVQNDPTAFCTHEEFLAGAQALREFCLRRAESAALQLRGEQADVDVSGLDISAMGSMGREMGGWNPQENRDNRRDGQKPREMPEWPGMPGRNPAEEPVRDWTGLLLCAVLAFGALAFVWFYPNRR